MDEDLNDPELLALFLDEAGGRLERILELVSEDDDDEHATTLLLRELHALKGASRMMGLGKIADACHQLEDMLEGEPTIPRAELEIQGDNLRSLIESLPESGESDQAVESETKGTRRPPAHRSREKLRVESVVIDDLADRGARLRVVSVAAEGLADRLFRLATLAEQGVGDRDPRQVLATLATSLRQVAMEFETGQRIFRRLSDRQLDALLRLQVQPLKPFLRGLADHARELAGSLGRKVKVRVQAGEARLDRRIISALREAFVHLVRNSVDHGIEDPDERVAAGKPEVGSIRILGKEEGDRVQIRIVDDGRGIDIDAVIRTAIERGIVDSGAADELDASGALQFLFRSGFTTREQTSELSGRGIGLDAVAASVRAVGGDLWLDSRAGEGTEVTVEVPVARRGEHVLVVRVGRHQVAVPSSPVRAFRRITSDMVEFNDDRLQLRIGDATVDARFLSELFGERPSDVGVMVEMIVGGRPVALVADSIVGEEEAMVRPLSRALGAPPSVDGMTLLSSGRPVPVISVHRPYQEPAEVDPSLLVAPAEPIRVLLVDDSRVTREMMRRMLEDAGFDVTGVGSAEDAIHALEAGDIDCLVTDIEMPGVDGLDLTRRLRGQADYADLPVVVVSTLDRPSDRLAGLESGADAYLTKQGLDVRELVALITRVGGRR